MPSPARAQARAHSMSTATALSIPPAFTAQIAVPAHLLGHGEDLETGPVGLGPDKRRIAGDRIEIDHIGVGRDDAGLMQRDRLFEETRVSTSQSLEKHGFLPCSSASPANVMASVPLRCR